MKNFSSKKINIAKYLNIKNDSISNIILKLKPENSRIYHFEKIENDNIKNKRDYLSPDIRKIHKIKVQKRILNDVNYVFSKSQNSINNEKFMNTKKYFSTKNINKNFQPIESVRISGRFNSFYTHYNPSILGDGLNTPFSHEFFNYKKNKYEIDSKLSLLSYK